MIEFIRISSDAPYERFVFLYEKAVKNHQHAPDAVCISSYNEKLKQPDARYVNLKYIVDNEWIFFSNYEGPKSEQFKLIENISATFYWPKIDVQIRIKGKIKKTNKDISDKHFKSRNRGKNSLAISSNQSKPIDSFDEVISKYEEVLNSTKILSRPNYWGGYSFKPFYFEFWEGHENRLNRRESFILKNDDWTSSILQP